jgi:hypothetical protein
VVAKDNQEMLENNFRQPRDLLNRQSGSPTKKSQHTLYPGDVEEVRLLEMMMMMR